VQTPALILAVDDDHCIAAWDRTLIQIWRRATTDRAASNMYTIARAFTAKHPRGANGLFIVESASEIPGAGARREFARFTQECVSKMACCAVVPEGGGFRAATVRSVVFGLGALLKPAFPYKFAADIDAATNLLAPNLSDGWGGREELRHAVTDIRARLDAPQLRRSA
jgi:hypothetical protein